MQHSPEVILRATRFCLTTNGETSEYAVKATDAELVVPDPQCAQQ